jgi:O-antigen/teichoic acid export membrane protein
LAPVIRLFTPGIALAAGLRVGTSATRITQRVEFAVFVQELIQPGLYLVLSVGAWALGGGLPGVVMGVLASYALSFLVVLGFLRRLFPELAAVGAGIESAFPDLVGLSVPVSLAAIFATVTMWVDRLIVGAFRPASEVGIYQAVSQASTLFAVILGAVTLVFGPMMAHLTVREDRARMLELFRVGTKWTLYASLPVLLVVWFAAGDVIELVFGLPYSRGAAALILLTAGQILNAASGPTGPFLNMTGHHVTWFRLSGLALLVNCLLGVLLVPRWGLEGAAISTAISVGGLSLASLVSVRRVLGAWPYDRRFLKVVAAVVATASFLGLAGLLIPAGNPFRLILMIPGAVLIFASVSVAFGLDGEDRAFLGMIRRLVTWRPEVEA